MVLRALAKWYRSSSVCLSLDRPALSCDYCGMEIADDQVGYDSCSGEIYHSGDCSLEMNAVVGRRSGDPQPLNITYTTIDAAVELCRKGLLKQCIDDD